MIHEFILEVVMRLLMFVLVNGLAKLIEKTAPHLLEKLFTLETKLIDKCASAEYSENVLHALHQRRVERGLCSAASSGLLCALRVVRERALRAFTDRQGPAVRRRWAVVMVMQASGSALAVIVEVLYMVRSSAARDFVSAHLVVVAIVLSVLSSAAFTTGMAMRAKFNAARRIK
jgi:hypothetical protein